jgi:hypothetical protein
MALDEAGVAGGEILEAVTTACVSSPIAVGGSETSGWVTCTGSEDNREDKDELTLLRLFLSLGETTIGAAISQNWNLGG